MKSKIITLIAAIMVSVAFCSCSKDDECDFDRVVSDKSTGHGLSKANLEGSWLLINESGFADFDQDGVREFFNEHIYHDNVHSVVLTFYYNDTCEISCFENGRYQHNKAVKYEYKISREINTVQIYGNGFDKTFKVNSFKDNILELEYYVNNCNVKFTFKYCEIE